MFSLATAHVMIGLRRALAAFLESSDLPGGALGYYAEISNWLSIFKQALYATNNYTHLVPLAGDIFLPGWKSHAQIPSGCGNHGIVPTLIIVRVGLGISTQETTFGVSSKMAFSSRPSELPMKPRRVNLSQDPVRTQAATLETVMDGLSHTDSLYNEHNSLSKTRIHDSDLTV
ncbi:hypothetical protein PHLCEN_2v8514 [Hermanssonia centrifuga]|uniref:Uncharacterized protein n=1 Tax=Hermanssonia centrifuga TaxID=98765 RepID=A0A2R6NTE1_9APHY|nr:hypothetical protein PHLCEN_2v8514 [Hermanssonia centrifuga]